MRAVLLLSALIMTLASSGALAADEFPPIAAAEKKVEAVPADPHALPTDTLFEQPEDLANIWSFVTHEPANNPDALYSADDFSNDKGWVIRNLFVASTLIGQDMTCADSVTWQIYRDGGGAPDGDPAGGGNPPVWEITLLPTDRQVSLGVSTGWNVLGMVRIDLSEPLFLPAGDYWITFFPTLDTSVCGSGYRRPASTTNGEEAMILSSSGAAGWPTVWTPASQTQLNGFGLYDFAFSLGGEACPSAVFEPADGSLGIPQVMVDGTDTCYSAVLNRLGGAYEFAVGSAGKIPCTCPSASFTSSSGILYISNVQVAGTSRSHNVELTKKVGAWEFVLSKVNK